MTLEPKLADVAERIDAHLRRFEADPKINVEHWWADLFGRVHASGRPYYSPSAVRAGSRVRVRYVAYQASHTMTKAEATEYLAWLDAGHVGKHWSRQP